MVICVQLGANDGSVDSTATALFLGSLKSRLVEPFWC